MRRALIIHAHPYPRHSRAGKALLDAVRSLSTARRDVTVRSLYDRYPDFAIDVAAEQSALRDASVIVWQCPFYWYGVPALLQHWFEKVLTQGFAYGDSGDAVAGKPLLWVTTTGTPEAAYEHGAMHAHDFASFVHPIEQTARFCGMSWQPPIVVHGAHDLSKEEMTAHCTRYRERLEELLEG